MDLFLIAGILNFLGYIPYFLGTFRGKTIPIQVSWFVWFSLGIVNLLSYYKISVILPLFGAGNVFGTLIIFLLSFKYGQKKFGFIDFFSLIGSVIGLLILFIFDLPQFALLLSVTVDLIGSIPTIYKTYINPDSEDFFAWLLFFFGSLLAFISADLSNFSIFYFHVYLVVLCGLVVIIKIKKLIFN